MTSMRCGTPVLAPGIAVWLAMPLWPSRTAVATRLPRPHAYRDGAEGARAHAGRAGARGLTERGEEAPSGARVWTHITVARLLARVSGSTLAPSADSSAHLDRLAC